MKFVKKTAEQWEQKRQARPNYQKALALWMFYR